MGAGSFHTAYSARNTQGKPIRNYPIKFCHVIQCRSLRVVRLKKAILLVRGNERPETFYPVAGKNVNESGQWFLRNDAAMNNDRLHDLWFRPRVRDPRRFFERYDVLLGLILVWILPGNFLSLNVNAMLMEEKGLQWKRFELQDHYSRWWLRSISSREKNSRSETEPVFNNTCKESSVKKLFSTRCCPVGIYSDNITKTQGLPV